MKRAVIAKFGMQQIKRQITNDTLLVQRNTLFTKRAFVVIFTVTQCASLARMLNIKIIC